MNNPNTEDAYRCLELRKRSKRGEHLSHKEHSFCSKMFVKYPEWYQFTESQVFNETVPFGSNVKRS